MKKDIIQKLVSSSEYLTNFTLKGQKFIRITSDGWESITLEAYPRSWDTETDKPALRFYPIYGRRFDILHKWFEPFSFKTLKDQRSNYTIGFDGEMLKTINYFYFLEDGSQFHERCSLLKEEIEKNAKIVFTRYATVEDFYHYNVQQLLRKETCTLPNVGADWTFIYLKASRLVDPQNYPIIKNSILKQIENMRKYGEPNVIEIYPNLDKILNALEQ